MALDLLGMVELCVTLMERGETDGMRKSEVPLTGTVAEAEPRLP